MEQKFYFLIEGIRYHAITIEDLCKMQSKYLSLLPLLDFFYAHNNTYKDIVVLSDKIKEALNNE